jgi:hypothetical protein
MSKIIRLTESDLIRLVKRVIEEQNGPGSECYFFSEVYVCVGEKSQYVTQLQKFLNSFKCCSDCVPIKEDGVFGPETKERLMKSKQTCFKGSNLIPKKRVINGNTEKYI